MFPESINKLKDFQQQGQGEHTYDDELDNSLNLHNEDGPSEIYPLQEDISIVSHPSLVLEELQKREPGDEYTDDNDLGYHQADFAED